VAISPNVDGSAIISVNGGIGLYYGFSLRVEVGRAEDVCQAGDVVLRDSSNVI